MLRREHDARFFILTVLLDGILLSALFLGLVELRHHFPDYWPLDLFPGEEPIFSPVHRPGRFLKFGLLVIPLWLLSLQLLGTYRELRRCPPQRLLLRVSGAALLGFLLVLLLLFAVQRLQFLSRSVLFGFTLLSVPLLYGSHRWMGRVMTRYRLKDWEVSRVLVVAPPESAGPMVRHLTAVPELGIQVEGWVPPDPVQVDHPPAPILGVLDDLPTILLDHPIHEVFVSSRLWRDPRLHQVAQLCEDLGVGFNLSANFLDFRQARAEVREFDGWPVLSFGQTPTDAVALAVKRLMDATLSAIGLVLLSPLLALTALAVKLQDGGPVIFSQERVGLYGRLFMMHKFRTMVPDAEARKKEIEHLNEMDGPVFKVTHDPRITPIGRFLRKTSIDELPQLWNVLKGEMSLVGPRPPIMSEVRQYQPWQRRRLSMKPGITCIWQISGRNEVDFETWMKMDLDYIDHWSLLLDLKILLLTVPVVLMRKGAR